MSHLVLIHDYLAGISRVREAVHGLDPEQLRARPVPGTWSTLEVLCHLADSEGLFTERIKRVLTEDRPMMLFSDPDQTAAALAYHERDAVEELACIEFLRRPMARILSAQSPEAWGRVGIHSREGERTLEQIVQKAVGHLEHHLGFIQAKREALERPAANQAVRRG